MKRLLCLLLLLLFQLSLHAGQERYELETAYFHDEQQKHTLESILTEEFKPYRGQLRLGFVDGETWIRIKLKAPQVNPMVVPAAPLIFRVEPYSLEKLTFYQKNAGSWTQQQGGERQLQQKKNMH